MMAVWIDDMKARKTIPTSQGMVTAVFSHMIADKKSELDDMAEQIKVNSRWIQNAGDSKEHYDITEAKVKLALSLGAKRITMKELARKLMDRDLKYYLEH